MFSCGFACGATSSGVGTASGGVGATSSGVKGFRFFVPSTDFTALSNVCVIVLPSIVLVIESL